MTGVGVPFGGKAAASGASARAVPVQVSLAEILDGGDDARQNGHPDAETHSDGVRQRGDLRPDFGCDPVDFRVQSGDLAVQFGCDPVDLAVQFGCDPVDLAVQSGCDPVDFRVQSGDLAVQSGDLAVQSGDLGPHARDLRPDFGCDPVDFRVQSDHFLPQPGDASVEAVRLLRDPGIERVPHPLEVEGCGGGGAGRLDNRPAGPALHPFGGAAVTGPVVFSLGDVSHGSDSFTAHYSPFRLGDASPVRRGSGPVVVALAAAMALSAAAVHAQGIATLGQEDGFRARLGDCPVEQLRAAWGGMSTLEAAAVEAEVLRLCTERAEAINRFIRSQDELDVALGGLVARQATAKAPPAASDIPANPPVDPDPDRAGDRMPARSSDFPPPAADGVTMAAPPPDRGTPVWLVSYTVQAGGGPWLAMLRGEICRTITLPPAEPGAPAEVRTLCDPTHGLYGVGDPLPDGWRVGSISAESVHLRPPEGQGDGMERISWSRPGDGSRAAEVTWNAVPEEVWQ